MDGIGEGWALETMPCSSVAIVGVQNHDDPCDRVDRDDVTEGTGRDRGGETGKSRRGFLGGRVPGIDARKRRVVQITERCGITENRELAECGNGEGEDDTIWVNQGYAPRRMTA